MSNFELSIAYCCPCVLHLVKREINKRKTLTSALLLDFVNGRLEGPLLIERFKKLGYILNTCVKHLFELICFDNVWCKHFSRKRNYFTYKTPDNGYLVRKCKQCYKKILINILDTFYRLIL